jgi:hypothetical protein
MKRVLASLCALACAALTPAAADAAAVQGALTGRITYTGASTLTVQTHGTSVGIITALTRTANGVAAGDWPYVWGGGHSEAGVASVGGRGPGYNGRRRGFDCSGSVAAVLSGAGLWPAGAGVPNDLGVVRELLAQGLIARGPGRAPNAVNLYDDPGVHIFMSIDGRFFGTSDGAGGNRRGGPTWLDDNAWDSYSHAFKRYHFLPSVLRNHTIYGHSYTFQTFAHPELVYGAELGDTVTVSYAEWPTGSMGIKAIAYAGARTITGTVSALTASTLAVQTTSGPLVTFSTSAVSQLVSGIQIGDGVAITYARDSAGLLVPHAVQITSTPAPANPANPAAPAGTGAASGPGTGAASGPGTGAPSDPGSSGAPTN